MKNTLHLVLKELRQKEKKSQKEIAECLKVSDRTYGHYEQGKREPSIDTLIDMAEYFKVPIDVLVGRYK